MTHKGYSARIEFDAEDRIFFGCIVGIRDIVTFHGEQQRYPRVYARGYLLGLGFALLRHL